MINSQKKGSVNFLLTFLEKDDLDKALLYVKNRNGFQYALVYSYEDASSQLTRYKLFIRFNFSVRLPNDPFNKAVTITGVRSMKKILQWLKSENATKTLELGEYYGKKYNINIVYQEREVEKSLFKKRKIPDSEDNSSQKDEKSTSNVEKSNKNFE